MFLMKIKHLNFIQSWPLSTCLFNICDEMGSTHKALVRHTEIGGYEEKYLFLELQAELTAFFIEHHFDLKEWLVNKL